MSSGIIFDTNEVGVRYTGVNVQVPDNDVARLMYYLNCVCTAVDYQQNQDIQSFTSYHYWFKLTTEDQKILIGLCYKLSPDIFEGKVFFHNEALCGDCLNDFLEISQVRERLMAANSIIVAGRTYEVNKIMVYKIQWIKKYYFDPIQRLSAVFTALSRPLIPDSPSIPPHYNNSSTSSTPLVSRSHTRRNDSCCCYKQACVIGIVCGILFVFAFIVTGVIMYFLIK